MGMFSIPVSFECSSCKSSFEYVDQFIGHKKVAHFREFQKIKSIVFQEKNAVEIQSSSSTSQQPKSTGIHSRSSNQIILLGPETNNSFDNIQANSDDEQDPFGLDFGSEMPEVEPESSETAAASTSTFFMELFPPPSNDEDPDPTVSVIDSDRFTADSSDAEILSPSSMVVIKEESPNDGICTGTVRTKPKPKCKIGPRSKVKRPSKQKPNPFVLVQKLTSKEIQTASPTKEVEDSTATDADADTDYGDLVTVTVHSADLTSKRSYECPLCPSVFPLKTKLDNHLVFEHADYRPYKCAHPNCDAAFKNKKGIDQHEKHSHSDERPFKCPFPGCTKRFKARFGIKPHYITHTTDRPWKCTYEGCDREFRQSDGLKCHLIARHSEEGLTIPINYTCDICKKGFYKKNSLQKHTAAHGKEIFYKCIHGCKANFKKQELVLHMRRVHGEQRGAAGCT